MLKLNMVRKKRNNCIKISEKIQRSPYFATEVEYKSFGFRITFRWIVVVFVALSNCTIEEIRCYDQMNSFAFTFIGCHCRRWEIDGILFSFQLDSRSIKEHIWYCERRCCCHSPSLSDARAPCIDLHQYGQDKQDKTFNKMNIKQTTTTIR